MLEPYLPGFSPIPTPSKNDEAAAAGRSEDDGAAMRSKKRIDFDSGMKKKKTLSKNPFESSSESLSVHLGELTPLEPSKRTITTTPAKNPFAKESESATDSSDTKNVKKNPFTSAAPAEGDDSADVEILEAKKSVDIPETPVSKGRAFAARLTPKSNWQNADKCNVCVQNFTSIRRRHHCRKCGASSCDKCSRCRFVAENSSEELRVCLHCSREMIANDVELEIVRAELTVLKSQLVEIKQQYAEERHLNSKYSENISRLNDTILGQKRRASLQSKELARMSAAVAALTAKIDHCEKDQMQIRSDQLHALERQRKDYDERINATREQIESIKTTRDRSSVTKEKSDAIDRGERTPTKKKESDNAEMSAPSARRAAPPKRSATSDSACACLVM
eukprot:g1560.t1